MLISSILSAKKMAPDIVLKYTAMPKADANVIYVCDLSKFAEQKS